MGEPARGGEEFERPGVPSLLAAELDLALQRPMLPAGSGRAVAIDTLAEGPVSSRKIGRHLRLAKAAQATVGQNHQPSGEQQPLVEIGLEPGCNGFARLKLSLDLPLPGFWDRVAGVERAVQGKLRFQIPLQQGPTVATAAKNRVGPVFAVSCYGILCVDPAEGPVARVAAGPPRGILAGRRT